MPLTNPPRHLAYPRDPDDEHIVNLIIEIRADYPVELDNDLLALPDYAPFRALSPNTKVLPPGAFLTAMESSRAGANGTGG